MQEDNSEFTYTEFQVTQATEGNPNLKTKHKKRNKY